MKEKTAVVVDSTVDFPDGVIQRFGLNVVPVHVVVDGKDYLDGVTITNRQLIDCMKSDRDIITRAATPAEYADTYENLLKTNDRILSLHVSSQLSDCHQCALSALKLLPERHAKRVTVIDTGTISICQGLYTLRALQFLKANTPPEAIEIKAMRYMDHSMNNFTVGSLNWLRKSGRISSLGALLGNMLSIKPIISVVDSRLTMVDRVRGKQSVLKQMIANATSLRDKFGGDYDIWVAHCDAREDACFLSGQLAMELNKDPRTIPVVEVGASIAVKVGPGSFNIGMVRKGTLP